MGADLDHELIHAQDVQALSRGLRTWLDTAALPNWWVFGADLERGGFHDALDEAARPILRPRRARVQARQVYVYSMAGLAGWAGPWRRGLDHGLSYLLGAHRRPDGLIRTLVNPDGSPADETAALYDQAFTLFALATAVQACPEKTNLPETAHALLQVLDATRRNPGGGFVEASDAQPFQSNPHMHLLEAALAWGEVQPGAPWDDLADELAELCLARFIDGEGGFLREFFTADWRPAPGQDGRIVEPGHQFEWAWLLERWGLLRGRADARRAARRLFEIAADHGVDHGRSVATDSLWDDLSVRSDMARLWPQTERIKAALILCREATDEAEQRRYYAHVAGGVRGLWRYLDTPVRGLWRDKMHADGSLVQEPAPASSLYHIACAITELNRFADEG